MIRQKRWLALLLCACALAVLCASSALAAHELAHPHDCAGQGCPVCALLAVLRRTNRGFGLALLAALACLFLAPGRPAPRPIGRAFLPVPATLVAANIRLND